jgi:hypothetical protein
MQKISLLLSLLLLAGCARFNFGWNEDSGRHDGPYMQSSFDELLAFGANMANIPPLSRSEVCSTLLKRQKDYPGTTGIELHLMVGRLFSDTCGDIPEILKGVGSIPPENLSDERVQKLVSIYTEALKRSQAVSIKLSSLERKHKKLQSVLESKNVSRSKKNTTISKKTEDESKKTEDESKKNETQLLREKLEAIRSMEKHLDESGDAN